MNAIEKRYNLDQRLQEHCRKVMASGHRMHWSETKWARDQFYIEAMRHMAMLEHELGVWRCEVDRLQS